MGRHSRRGPVPKGTADTTAGRGSRERGRDDRDPDGSDPDGRGARVATQGAERPRGENWDTAGTVPPARPQPSRTTPPHGTPRLPDGTPAHGVPRLPDGTPAHGMPRLPDGTPARGIPRYDGGTPAGGVPRFPDGTPAHGMPRLPDGTPAHGIPRARGGHPEQWEAGGGWGRLGAGGGVGVPGQGGNFAGAATPLRPGVPFPRQRQAPPEGPRPDYLDAFDRDDEDGEDDDVFMPRPRGTARAVDVSAPPAERGPETAETEAGDGAAPPAGAPAPGKGAKGRAFTGIAAAAVTTVLAVVVAGQVADGRTGADARTQAATDQGGDLRAFAGADGADPSPSPAPSATPLTYDQQMNAKYPLSPTLKGPGKFETVPGAAKAPGKGQKFTYRVDVEQGLELDGRLFADAVQKTLNDDRSWAHGGARTFERVPSGKADFVITLASPGTTATWCAKSGLDTTEDNVSCDSAATERVMINAYRWAQGSKTYGDKMFAYRQMLINHEVGHRLGHGHVNCEKNGQLAPVMQQQTKFLDHDGIHCLPNPWPYPGS
ncbi:DUF3152 domain-containing protein [Streptomyces naganishii]|uniref:DUF3152 domain-containing protein n=1 Tax=Streptomyces naganishii JCM 4654 TaxID=1306179 RepID=A0A919CWA1_9ACTN|nr:DUF3152 domain-containing protein [Streptomyces naganishii]GHD90400.1 hypothetical protein GCM10010508_34970 [Streptomyces naganishii JCM 4654]